MIPCTASSSHNDHARMLDKDVKDEENLCSLLNVKTNRPMLGYPLTKAKIECLSGKAGPWELTTLELMSCIEPVIESIPKQLGEDVVVTNFGIKTKVQL